MRSPCASIVVLAPTTDAPEMYRLILPTQAAAVADSEFAFTVIEDLSEFSFDSADAMFLRGSAGPQVLGPVTNFVRRGGKLIVDFDAYLEPPPYHPSGGTFLCKRPTPELLAGSASLVITASEELCSQLQLYAARVAVRESVVGTSKQSGSLGAGSGTSAPVIVWGADAGRNLGLRMVSSVLSRVLLENPHASLLAFGSLDVHALQLPGEQVRVVPRQDLSQYMSLLGSADIAIAPVEDSLHDSCKPNTLLLEYAAAGLPTVASEWPATRRLVAEGFPLKIARDSQAWYENLSALIRDPQNARDIGLAGRVWHAARSESSDPGRQFLHLLRSALA